MTKCRALFVEVSLLEDSASQFGVLADLEGSVAAVELPRPEHASPASASASVSASLGSVGQNFC